ncbi:anaerobic ribonucleoside-triphosphate reductase activating protein [Desulfococcus multivorans]|uniref:Anaerobic ribonucleoside-triphosphate reductase activating protein n=1 Tax=Desulfococcus multivorans DSM 2059 TaxID=1121405 RepID=S7TFQ1_DESML|nr:anaerobic ribonucleoside-triphosphate reductase activating protein [Desulfococcus multivorans]AOY60064.1 NrdG: anaerobic ribonucleoside-triphosphate reductase, activating enzyme [Desulfococcus multivorans]AQV02202.1 anaerobic ribonucleoside-triphosphate reductase activating protein [Desulfococcus multivorans]EPR36057.1 anaerobic ribonucleoside-triphosphate reductase activating protein [Desulfococcus multivorans DSM 2059]SJZ37721.1 pyruvate formate lyase activating enzyme [Desulfococcus multi
MRIGGLRKTSLIDYPGKVACVVFLSGCNFRCPYCHNPAMARGDAGAAVSSEAFFELLADRAGFLDGVVVSGGEPTLQADLPVLCARIKAMGYPVKLDTNGSRPEVLADLIRRGLVDYVAMDVKTDPRGYAPLIHPDPDPRDLLSSIRTIMDAGLPYEFRTTCVKPLVDPEILETICRLIHGADLYVLQQCREEEVLDPGFFQNGPNRRFSDEALSDLRKACALWVRCCEVR